MIYLAIKAAVSEVFIAVASKFARRYPIDCNGSDAEIGGSMLDVNLGGEMVPWPII